MQRGYSAGRAGLALAITSLICLVVIPASSASPTSRADSRPRDAFAMTFTPTTATAVAWPRPAALPSAPGPTSFTVTFTPAPTRTASGAVVPATEPIITCSGKVNYPHASSHVPGTVNVTDTISCNDVVASIVLRTYLWQRFDDIYEIVGRGSTTKYNTTYANGNAASTNCVDTQYYGEGTVTVTAPPGYSPATIQQTAYSPYVTIACP